MTAARNRRVWVAALLMGLGLPLSAAHAGIFDDSGPYGTPWENFQRAGNPGCIAPWARPSNERRDVGYYVGGGVPKRGEGRYANEGTWGWDYRPPLSTVALRWTHGRRYQGGTGQYQAEAPVRTFHQFKGPK